MKTQQRTVSLLDDQISVTSSSTIDTEVANRILETVEKENNVPYFGLDPGLYDSLVMGQVC